MRRPAHELRAALALLERAETVLRRLRDHRCVVSFKMPPMVLQDATGAPIERGEAGRLQLEHYRAQIDARRIATADLRHQLRTIAASLGNDLPTTSFIQPALHEGAPFLCYARGESLSRPALLNLCEWACPWCCNAAEEDIDATRDRLEPQLTVALVVRRGDPKAFKKDGSLTAAARRFIVALPLPGQAAQAMTLEGIARKVGIAFDTVRKLSVALQRHGMVACDQDGCWRRTGELEE